MTASAAPMRRSMQTTEAAVKATGTRFCAQHQGHIDATAGSFVLRGRVNRWICTKCQACGRKPR